MEMNVKRPLILMIEDDQIFVYMMKYFLKNNGMELLGNYSNTKDALKVIKEKKPDIILLDINLEGELTGIDFSIIIRKNHKNTICIGTRSGFSKVVSRHMPFPIAGNHRKICPVHKPVISLHNGLRT